MLTIAAASPSSSAARSVFPSFETASPNGHERRLAVGSGGKFCGAGASLGGGMGITRRSTALPVSGDHEKTWTTSPCSPGVLAGIFASVMSVSGSPDT